MERLITQFDKQYVPRKLIHASSDIGMINDCSTCSAVCKEFLDKRCENCPLQEVFSRLGAYEETGLAPEQINAGKWKYDGSREESRVSDETLYRAVNKQNEFIRWYRAKYNEEPEFDIVILQIMLELKERRAAEGRNRHNGTD